MLINRVGLEVEFFLKDKKGKLLTPGTYGFSHDNYLLLGEIRGKPGKNSEETLTNFLVEYFRVQTEIEKLDLVMDTKAGWQLISPQENADILRKMDEKEISQCKNINPDIDLLALSSQKMDGDKIIGVYISSGLHIHFSSVEEKIIKGEEYSYTPVDIPIGLTSLSSVINLQTINLFKKIKNGDISETAISVSRITLPVIKYIVSSFDRDILSKFTLKNRSHLKYRNPGFYELKSDYGFEYRSLPFNDKVFSQLREIVNYSFEKLNSITP